MSEVREELNDILQHYGVKGMGAAMAGKAAYSAATSPESIRRGKNIIQAIKRSPIRYVDGKKMTNIVRDASALATGR